MGNFFENFAFFAKQIKAKFRVKNESMNICVDLLHFGVTHWNLDLTV